MSDVRTTDEYGEPLPRPPGSGRRKLLFALAAVLLVAGIAAGVWAVWPRETTDEVIARYRPQFAEVRAKLKRIAAKLPPVGSVRGDTLPPNLNPKPVYDVPGRTFNTSIMMAAHCDDPDKKLKSPTDFDLLFFEDGLHHQLSWTGEKREPNRWSETARRDFAAGFERSLALPYLVVARPASYNPPVAVNEKTFLGGELDLEVFLVDLRTEAVLGAFRRTVRPDPQLMVTFRKDKQQNESVEGFVYSNVWQKAQAEVRAALARGTGGTFNTERSRN